MSTDKERLSPTNDPAVNRALAALRELPETRNLHRPPLQLTTGAGIAIAGAWIAGGAVTITLLLICLVFSPLSDAEMKQLEWFWLFIAGFLLASPMIAAYSISKLILSKD